MKNLIKRHIRIFYDKNKKSFYIIINKKRIYIKENNKKLISNLLKKKIEFKQNKVTKQNIKKYIDEYLKTILKTFYTNNLNTQDNNKGLIYPLSNKQIKINDDILIRLDDKLYKTNFLKNISKYKYPMIEQEKINKIKYTPNNKIRIDFDSGNYYEFNNTEEIRRIMPKLWKEKKKEFIEIENKNKYKKQKEIKNKIIRQEYSNIKNYYNLIEENYEDLLNKIDENINNFNSNFLSNFFKTNKREIKDKLKFFNNLEREEKIIFYIDRMKELNINNINKEFLKQGIKKKQIYQNQNIFENYDEVKQMENEYDDKILNVQEKKKINTEEFNEPSIFVKTKQSLYESPKKLSFFESPIQKIKEEEDEFIEPIFENEKDEKEDEEKIHMINVYQRQNKYDDEELDFSNGLNKNKIGLNNLQIDKILSPFKEYIKTISLNNIDNIIKYIKQNNLKKFCFIINTLNEGVNMIGHWIAIYVDLINDMSFEIYDPLAKEKRNVYNILHQKFTELFNYFEIPNYLKFKINKIKQQSSNSANCGWFCIRFLLMRIQNINFKKATSYFKGIKNNENNINNLKKTYIKFGYV